jgi:hypothetical protein
MCQVFRSQPFWPLGAISARAGRPVPGRRLQRQPAESQRVGTWETHSGSKPSQAVASAVLLCCFCWLCCGGVHCGSRLSTFPRRKAALPVEDIRHVEVTQSDFVRAIQERAEHRADPLELNRAAECTECPRLPPQPGSMPYVGMYVRSLKQQMSSKLTEEAMSQLLPTFR